MDRETLFWLGFVGIFFAVAAIDLFATTHRHGPAGLRTALFWTSIWVSVALLYGLAIYLWHPRGAEFAPLFIAGYLTEYSLSVDNLFVFIMIFSLMGVRESHQPKLIKLGILLSIVLRVLFILFGIALIANFHWLIYAFGALLIWTALKMLLTKADDQVDPSNNVLHRLASRWLPMDPDPETRRLISRREGKIRITPLFLVFLVIGSTDVLFAIDSIPAILGISEEPFVVITSNVFAVLGLVSLFFAIRGVMGLFRFLKHGVSLVLFFIGAKMIAGIHHPVDEWFKAHTWVSLTVIGAILVFAVVLSIVISEEVAVERARAEGKPGGGPGGA
jgi:tellurite resistance protein TerC